MAATLRERLVEHWLRSFPSSRTSAAPTSLGGLGGASRVGKAARGRHDGMGWLLAGLVSLP
eukprot:3233343-Heterocapsa_arctica.AAC.1